MKGIEGLSSTRSGDITGTGGNTDPETNGHKGDHRTGDKVNDLAWRYKVFEQKSLHNAPYKSTNR